MASVRITWEGQLRFDGTDSKGIPVDIDGHQDLGVRLHVRPQRAVHGARERLDQDRAAVRELLGHHVELRAVREEHPAPPATGSL